MKEIVSKPQLYAVFFHEMRVVAREHGYNLCVHGSLARDFDLVAIPWVDEPSDELALVKALDEALTGASLDSRDAYGFSVLGGGRHAYIINLNRSRVSGSADPQWYIDLSITPNGAK